MKTEKNDSNCVGVDYCSLEKLVIGIKKEIVDANRKLNKRLIKVLDTVCINQDLDLIQLPSCWYAMSEVDVDIKVHMFASKDSSGSINFSVAPINASFENYYMKPKGGL